ncbi:hypothetical protein D3C80_2065230 [compost metagenome]
MPYCPMRMWFWVPVDFQLNEAGLRQLDRLVLWYPYKFVLAFNSKSTEGRSDLLRSGFSLCTKNLDGVF